MKISLRQHLPVLSLTAGILAAMTALVIYAPTLYRLFCDVTGYGGTVRRAEAVAASASGAREARPGAATFTVYFDSNVAPGLPWAFRPAQRKLVVRAGEAVKAYYEATNLSDETVVARATFNVTPFEVAPYFFKIECFCFTEERLGPGESARMPLVFYVDEALLQSADTKAVRALTLSYTFFKQEGLSPEAVGAARDLKQGSEAIEAAIEGGAALPFDNDAPRR